MQVRAVGLKPKKCCFHVNSLDTGRQIIGFALPLIRTRPVIFHSPETFVDYLKAYDRRQNLSEEKKKLADEVDKLLADKLMGGFVMDLSGKEANTFLEKLKPGSVKATLVRPSYEDPTGFYVSRRVGGAGSKKIEHLFFRLDFTSNAQGAFEMKAECHSVDKKCYVTISNVSCLQKYLSFFEVGEPKAQGQALPGDRIDPEYL